MENFNYNLDSKEEAFIELIDRETFVSLINDRIQDESFGSEIPRLITIRSQGAVIIFEYDKKTLDLRPEEISSIKNCMSGFLEAFRKKYQMAKNSLVFKAIHHATAKKYVESILKASEDVRYLVGIGRSLRNQKRDIKRRLEGEA